MRAVLASVGVDALQGYRARTPHRVPVGAGVGPASGVGPVSGGRDADAR
jgi:hypothetical protein